MKLKCVAFIISVFTFSISASEYLENSPNIFKDLLDKFHLNFGIVFYCDPLDTDVWVEVVRRDLKYLSFYQVSSPVFNLNNSWNLMRYENRQLGIHFDTTCSETRKIFDEFSRFNFFNASYIWLLLTDDSESLFEVLSFQNINVDAEITVAVKTNQNTAQLFDVYNPSSRSNGEVVIQPKGTWDDANGLNITLNGSKFDKRSDLKGIYIQSGIVATAVPKHQTLQEYMDSDDYPLNDAQHRHNYRLFKILSEKHNFK